VAVTLSVAIGRGYKVPHPARVIRGHPPTEQDPSMGDRQFDLEEYRGLREALETSILPLATS
jgi:hypothetical protein